MSIPTRIAPRLRNCLSLAGPSRRFTTTANAAKDEWPQRFPLGPYYENLLKSPPLIPEVKPEEPPNSADPEVLPPGKKHVPSKETPSDTTTPKPKRKPGRPRKTDSGSSASQKAETSSSTSPETFSTTMTPTEPTPLERARLVFGSRELGPAELAARAAERKNASTYIAGVLVPPQPTEPDNCCMSGCVNCVWERYREEMEDWSAANAEAQRRLKAGDSTMDADGGGSEANWGPQVGDTKIAKNLWDDQVFEGVPLGIREFMKQEKRLKERHEREGTIGS